MKTNAKPCNPTLGTGFQEARPAVSITVVCYLDGYIGGKNPASLHSLTHSVGMMLGRLVPC